VAPGECLGNPRPDDQAGAPIDDRVGDVARALERDRELIVINPEIRERPADVVIATEGVDDLELRDVGRPRIGEVRIPRS
jgi:hypothetical protein